MSGPSQETAPRRIGYFGRPGSFSHEVALRCFAGEDLVSFDEQGEGFERLKSGKDEFIVVPFENSIGGAVPETLDQLILMKNWEREYQILEQLVYPVRLCLLRLAGPAPVRKVYSHFVPLQVVQGWLKRRHPDAERILVGNTSAAAAMAARDPEAAAIGNAAAAKVYGLEIAANDLAPPSTNITRFFVVGRAGSRPASRAPARRAMIHIRLRNVAGALADALVILKKHRVNLTQILSRPVRGSRGEHQFLLEMDLAPNFATEKLWTALARGTASLHVLGIYPVRPLRGSR